MKKISCVIVDDEAGNRAVLGKYLEKYCPNIKKTGEAASADDAYGLIADLSPDLVFLDIKMPSKSGFDLLRMFDKLDFDVIFVSGFDEFAIKAFEFNAIDYILKPIDYQKLIAAVKKVEERISLKTLQAQNILHLVHNIDERKELIKKIAFHQQGKVQMVDIHEIIMLEAVRNYCEITTTDGQKFISAKSLREYESLLANIPFFLRVNKSMMINVQHIASYTKGDFCLITMNDKTEVEVSRRKKTAILERIRDHIG